MSKIIGALIFVGASIAAYATGIAFVNYSGNAHSLTARVIVPAQATNGGGGDGGNGSNGLDAFGLPLPPSSPTTAVASLNFLDSMGVVIGPSANEPPRQYAALFNYLGIKRLRGAFGSPGGNSASYVSQICALVPGLKAIYGLAGPATENWHVTTSVLTSEVANAKILANIGCLLALEGANEPESWPIEYNGVAGGGSGTWTPVAQQQRDWYAAGKADLVIKNYPVFNISNPGAETDNVGLQFLQIPSGSGLVMEDGTTYADYANMHNYVVWRGSTRPVSNIAWNNADPVNHIPPAQYPLVDDHGVTWAHHYQGYSSAQLTSLPRVTTETGWYPGGDDTSGKIALSTYTAQFERGYQETFIYQMTVGEGGASFGLFSRAPSNAIQAAAAAVALPAAKYIHNFTTILADASNSFTPGTMNWSISDQPSTVHPLLLQKSNRHYFLVVDDERWDGGTDNFTVQLGQAFRHVNVYDPTIQTAPLTSFTNVSSVGLQSDHLNIIEAY